MTPPLPADGDESGQPGDTSSTPSLTEQVELLDAAVGVRPVPEDVVVWRALGEEAFQLPWRDLAGTLHRELGYLAVSLIRYEDLAAAPALLDLRVPKGTPAIYLNAFDQHGVLPAPTLLLGRGLYLYVHSLRRQDSQWYVRAEILPTAGREAGPPPYP